MKKIIILICSIFVLVGCFKEKCGITTYFKETILESDSEHNFAFTLENGESTFFVVYMIEDDKQATKIFDSFTVHDVNTKSVNYTYYISRNEVDVTDNDSDETVCIVDSNTGEDSGKLASRCSKKQIKDANKLLDAYHQILNDLDVSEQDLFEYMDSITQKHINN